MGTVRRRKENIGWNSEIYVWVSEEIQIRKTSIAIYT